MTGRSERGHRLRHVMAAVALIFAAAAAVIVLTHRWPPMHDASSHISTAVVADALLAGDAFARAHFAFDLAPIPYWTATGVMVALLQVLDPLASHQVLMLIYLLGLPLSVVYLLRVAGHAERAPIAGAVAVLVGFNWAYWFGESPFLIGHPLAITAYAVFLQLNTVRSLRFAAFVVLAALTYLSHVFALGVLLAAAGSVTLLRRWYRASSAQWAAVAIVSALMMMAAWFIFAPQEHGATRGRMVWDPALWRLGAVIINPLDSPTDLLRAINPGFILTLAALLVVPPVLRRSQTRLLDILDPRLALPAGALILLSWLGPSGIQDPMGFEDISLRFTLGALLFGVAALPAPPTRRVWAAMPVLLVAAYGVIRLSDVWGVHQRLDERSARLHQALLSKVEPGARVLPLRTLDGYPHREGSILHRFANYAVMEPGAYCPHIFARTGQQPLRHLHVREYRKLEQLSIEPHEWGFYDYCVVEGDVVPATVRARGEHVASAEGFHLFRLARSVAVSHR